MSKARRRTVQDFPLPRSARTQNLRPPSIRLATVVAAAFDEWPGLGHASLDALSFFSLLTGTRTNAPQGSLERDDQPPLIPL